MDIHVDYPLGDVLVFLTGQTEIEMACDILFDKAERVDYHHDVRDRKVRALLILPIYGAMPTGTVALRGPSYYMSNIIMMSVVCL